MLLFSSSSSSMQFVYLRLKTGITVGCQTDKISFRAKYKLQAEAGWRGRACQHCQQCRQMAIARAMNASHACMQNTRETRFEFIFFCCGSRSLRKSHNCIEIYWYIKLWINFSVMLSGTECGHKFSSTVLFVRLNLPICIRFGWLNCW